ncbi:AbrB family transcriptional regulator [Lactiplantibacillus paraplantarum]|uniref:AbrB family transcriptional regulator n=1 Tax=Lactiplantibacillus paraplantarum TaxID=60520 RepID=UPI0023AAFC54|nr:AbrB family transcriptional regulator [Lactiplantibacillus paraplantarum]WEE35827.1 AbrB family transcriptional regulator [Lactiplantibacillus paraplantarum]
MGNPDEKDVKMFKNGNSYALRVSKKDREALNANLDTKFRRIVTNDGEKIIFEKINPHEPSALDIASKLFDEHADLMKRLENL